MFLQFIIPYYGKSELVLSAINSVLNQIDIDGVGIIVVDDNHKDEQGLIESEKVYSFIDIHNSISPIPILYLKNENNMGVGPTRNRGLAAASAEWVSFIDSDDEIKVEFVSIFREELKKHKFKVFVGKYQYQRGNTVVFSNEMTWLHGKIYNLAFLRYNGIDFPPLRFNEDGGFNLMVFEMTKAIYYYQGDIIIYDWKNDNLDSLTKKDNSPEYTTIFYTKTVTYAFQHILKKYSINQTTRLTSTIVRLYIFYVWVLYENGDIKDCETEMQKFFDLIHSTEWYKSDRLKKKIAVSLAVGETPPAIIPEITLAQFVKKFESEPLNFR